jgi:uncharacterized protein
MRVLISGASGLIGRALTRALRDAGREPMALVRRAPQPGEVQWGPGKPLDSAKLAGCTAVVHLAGRSVAGLWTKKAKQEIRDSRVEGTRTLANAIAESHSQSGQPQVLLSASAVGYYGDRAEEWVTEESPPGKGFLAEVAQEWEAATVPASAAGVRVVSLRIGVVLAGEGGALKPMLLPFRFGLGGRTGSGKQYWSWVSLEDVVGAILFALQNNSLRGPVNVVSPEPARNEEFVRALAAGLHRPAIFPLPEWVVRTVFGEMGEAALLASTRVEPAKLKAAGYHFRRPKLKDAIHAALQPNLR